MNRESIVALLREEGRGGSLSRAELAVLLGVSRQDGQLGQILEAMLAAGELVKADAGRNGRYALPSA